MENSIFPGFKLEETIISSGKKVGLPVRYYDWSIMMAYIPASASKVRDLLPTENLKPVEPSQGTAIVILAAMQHRHVDQLSSYNEAAVLIPVTSGQQQNTLPPPVFPGNTQCFDLYFHHLPVTTQDACDVGVDIYGFPKFVADITFEDKGNSCLCELSVDGKDIFTLEVKKITAESQPVNFFCYTVKDGQLIKTFVPTQGEYAMSNVPEDVKYTIGNHAIAKELKELDMAESAAEYVYAAKVQGLLFPPGEYSAL